VKKPQSNLGLLSFVLVIYRNWRHRL
jgi:hypothetical protein